MARVEAIFRRTGQSDEEAVNIGGIEIDKTAHLVK